MQAKQPITDEQFIQLLVRHESELRAFTLTLLPCPADAEDVVQEACVAMWKRLRDLNDGKAFRAWAYTFIRFTALNHIRKRQRSPLLFSDKLTDLLAQEGSEELERSSAEFHALAGCIEKLPEEQRELIRQYYQQNKVNMDEVAQVMKRNTAGLYKALERTREILRICIEGRLSVLGFDVANPGN